MSSTSILVPIVVGVLADCHFFQRNACCRWLLHKLDHCSLHKLLVVIPVYSSIITLVENYNSNWINNRVTVYFEYSMSKYFYLAVIHFHSFVPIISIMTVVLSAYCTVCWSWMISQRMFHSSTSSLIISQMIIPYQNKVFDVRFESCNDLE